MSHIVKPEAISLHENVRVESDWSLLNDYRREENFRQLNILYFKFTFGFNFRIVRYACIHYSIMQNFSFRFNFRMHVNLRK